LGLDALISDNRFLDVLPKDVSKGPSLLRLLTHLGIDNRKVLVAGDTLNDLSMLAMGLPAVAVGNSEPALLDEVKGLDHVHAARQHGVAGIAEAILHHKLYA
jgi:hydroxymethylpyrimidine pyrophosphatase-like HAD family hydrolase